MITNDKVMQVLKEVVDPEIGLVDLNMINSGDEKNIPMSQAQGSTLKG